MSSVDKPEPEFPRRYGKYELLERIGEGGMAEAFRARLPGAAGFEKILVIKRILPHLSRNKRFVQMFVNEAKLAAQIQHQNVVQVFELGEVDNGELFIAMEYVRGVDLRGILRAAAQRVLRIPIWFAVHTVAEVLGGLSHAHELFDADGSPLHVVHRDVTPSNIFVSYMGEVKLADFGIAKAVGQVSETRSGQLKGKISYMPPEQVHGQPLDARADVFAVGVVLWECLTQRRLFGGRPDFETMLAICEGKREPPSRYNPKVPPELDAVTLMALEADREQRISSAREFQARLLEVLSRIRPRLLPSEIRHVVEVLLGKKAPDPQLGADLPYDTLSYGPEPSASRIPPPPESFPVTSDLRPFYTADLRPPPRTPSPPGPTEPPASAPSALPPPLVPPPNDPRTMTGFVPPTPAAGLSGPFRVPEPSFARAPDPARTSGVLPALDLPPPELAPVAAAPWPPTPLPPQQPPMSGPPPWPGAPQQPPWRQTPPQQLPAIPTGSPPPPPSAWGLGYPGEGSLQDPRAYADRTRGTDYQDPGDPRWSVPTPASGLGAARTTGSLPRIDPNTSSPQLPYAGPPSMTALPALPSNPLGQLVPPGLATPPAGGLPVPVGLPPPGGLDGPMPGLDFAAGGFPATSDPSPTPSIPMPGYAPLPAVADVGFGPPTGSVVPVWPGAGTPGPRVPPGAPGMTPMQRGASSLGAPVIPGMPTQPPDGAPRRKTSSVAAIDLAGEGAPIEPPPLMAGTYAGAYPFWLRTKDGFTQGPMSYEELLKLCDPRDGKVKEVSADGQTWLDIPTFASLSGLDYLGQDSSALKNVTMVSSLDKRSLVAVLARLARGAESGRLVIMDKGSGKVARREIDVLRGAPTFVYADRLDLQLPSIVVQRQIVSGDLVPELIHQVVRKREPLEELISRRAALDMARHRPLFMRDRLVDLFKWRVGKFAFDAGATPRGGTPFAPSLLHVLFDGVHRGFTRTELVDRLDRYMNVKLDRSERFDEILANMDLTKAQEAAAIRLAEGRPLGQLLKKYPNEGLVHMIMAYILIEMDLLLAPLG